MSRVGTLPIPVPSGVTVEVAQGNAVSVKGPKGELSAQIAGALTISQNESTITIERPDNDRHNRSQHGLARTLDRKSVV